MTCDLRVHALHLHIEQFHIKVHLYTCIQYMSHAYTSITRTSMYTNVHACTCTMTK